MVDDDSEENDEDYDAEDEDIESNRDSFRPRTF